MAYVVSILVGVVVGAAYAIIGVRSPAPPVVALFGLLGIVIGEQGLLLVKAHLAERVAVLSPHLSQLREDGATRPATSPERRPP